MTLQTDAGAGDDTGEQFITRNTVFDQRVVVMQQSLQGFDAEVVVGFCQEHARRRREPLPPGALQELALGMAQLRGQRGRWRGFVLQALHPAIKPVQPGPQIKRAGFVFRVTALGQAFAERAGATTVESA